MGTQGCLSPGQSFCGAVSVVSEALSSLNPGVQAGDGTASFSIMSLPGWGRLSPSWGSASPSQGLGPASEEACPSGLKMMLSLAWEDFFTDYRATIRVCRPQRTPGSFPLRQGSMSRDLQRDLGSRLL